MGEEKIHSLYLQSKDTSSQFRYSYVTRTSLLAIRTSLLAISYIATWDLYIATCDSYIATCDFVHRYLRFVHRYLRFVHRYLRFRGLHINPNIYRIVSSVGLDDCDAMALIGQSRVLSTALPRNKNFPHTCCMNRLALSSTKGDVDCCVAYCFLAPY